MKYTYLAEVAKVGLIEAESSLPDHPHAPVKTMPMQDLAPGQARGPAHGVDPIPCSAILIEKWTMGCYFILHANTSSEEVNSDSHYMRKEVYNILVLGLWRLENHLRHEHRIVKSFDSEYLTRLDMSLGVFCGLFAYHLPVQT